MFAGWKGRGDRERQGVNGGLAGGEFEENVGRFGEAEVRVRSDAKVGDAAAAGVVFDETKKLARGAGSDLVRFEEDGGGDIAAGAADVESQRAGEHEMRAERDAAGSGVFDEAPAGVGSGAGENEGAEGGPDADALAPKKEQNSGGGEGAEQGEEEGGRTAAVAGALVGRRVRGLGVERLESVHGVRGRGDGSVRCARPGADR